MKTLVAAAIFFLLFASFASQAKAQIVPGHRNGAAPHPFSIGGYAGFALQSSVPPNTISDLMAMVGVYGELNRGYFHPGLDLRGVGAAGEGVGGTLVGPRLAFSYNILHPYVEALIGPNHVVRNNVDIGGITANFVAGLDLDYHPNLRWRVIEYSQGTFTGVSGARPRTLTTGLVIYFP